VVVQGGLFAFTTRHPVTMKTDPTDYERQVVGEFEVFSHAPAYIETLLAQHSFTRLRMQRCFVGDDLFLLWVVGRH
jgi:predicted TPR repeat methyltransferase